MAKHRVETVVQNGSHKNNGQRVEVADNVVGDTVGGEHGGQVRGGRTDTVVVEVLDGEETEDTSGLESTADILDELIAPLSLVTSAASSDDRGLSRLPETVTTNSLDTASAEADAEDSEDVGKIRTARRVKNEALAKVPEQNRERDVEDQGDEESQPPANVLLAVCSLKKVSDHSFRHFKH